jgi:cellulose synthase/poly-beta-1,6-N-acetylglucosamine synthase-like glycosyltransferase
MVVFYLAVIVPIGFWEIGMTSDPPDLESPVPEISVVIPAYNEEEWIGQCIESVLATDYPADKREIIVVDDGSDDATYEQALQYSDRGVRVRRRANGGRDAALNYGLYCSNGDIFVMVDADSLLTELSLKRIAGALQSDPDLGAVAGDVRVLNTDCLLTKIQAVEYMFSIHTFRRACSFFDAVPICPGAVSGFRREAIDNVHGFDPDTVTEDFDTTVQVLKDGWTVRQVDGVVHTEAPFTLADLYTQRVRWYTGCLQNLVKHRDVFVAAESTYLHRFTFPVVAISYLLRPLVGLLTPVFLLYGLFVSHWAVGLVSIAYFIIVIGIVVAATLYLLDEPLYLVPWVIPFLIGYKQFIDFVFIRCIVGYLFGVDVEWGTIQRDARPEVEA